MGYAQQVIGHDVERLETRHRWVIRSQLERLDAERVVL